MQRTSLRLAIAVPQAGKLDELERFCAEAAAAGAEMLLLPEEYIEAELVEIVRGAAAAYGLWIVCGLDDRRQAGQRFMTAVVIDDQGEIQGEHRKTSLTEWEIEAGYEPGSSLETSETPWGKLGIAVCYELHFPEVARSYALAGARLIFNPIGSGMWHEAQYRQWNAIAAARASENSAYVIGCSHFNDAIPLAFAYSPDGAPLLESRNENTLSLLTLELAEMPAPERKFSQRRPELYSRIVDAR